MVTASQCELCDSSCVIGHCRSFETQLSRVEAELLRREAPPSYGQLIAQGLIPPVEDFPVCSGSQVEIHCLSAALSLTCLSTCQFSCLFYCLSSCLSTCPSPVCPPVSLTVCLFCSFCSQASVLENLRLAVRSQLGFTSLRLPSGRHSNLWRRLFTFSRSRRSGSLALVSADLEDSAGTGSTGSSGSDLLSPDSDDTDTEGERGRERGVGAVGGPVAPLPQKTAPSTAVEAVVSVTTSATSMTPAPGHGRGRDRPREAPPPSSPVAVVTSSPDPDRHSDASELQAPPTSALQRLARNLHRLARTLTRTSQNQQDQTWTNHSPLRQLETGRGGAEAAERRGSREEEEDVELLIPVSDSDSSSSSSILVSDVRHTLLEPHPSSTSGHGPRHHRGNVCRGGRDGPCEHCGMVHTAQIPDACLEATGKTESSDDELLLLC